jgi:NADP-dependent 3-hydroxy acid dehydrogenase YdfG
MDLKNKVIVITGASSGLGREISILLAEQGGIVALISKSGDELKKVKAEIGANAEYFVCNLVNAKEVENTIARIHKKFGKIDVLINNAGIWFEGLTEKHSPDKLAELFDVISLGTIYTTNYTLPILKKQNAGQILNIVSVAGIETPGNMGPFSPYTAAKYAVTGFTKSLEEELKGTNIKVMGIYPGGMNTPLFKKAGFDYTENEDWMMDKKDVSKIVLFMLSQPKDMIIDHLVVRKFG